MLGHVRSWAGARFLQPFKPDYYSVGLSELSPRFPIIARQLLEGLKYEPYQASWIGSRGFATHFTPIEHDQAVHQMSTFLSRMLTDATRESRASWVVDDTPYNLSELQSLTQWAKFRLVVMLRDVDDVAESLKKVPWAPNELAVCRKHAQMYADQWAHAKRMLEPGQYIEIELSELRQHPDATLALVARHLDISGGFDSCRINQDWPSDKQQDDWR